MNDDALNRETRPSTKAKRRKTRKKLLPLEPVALGELQISALPPPQPKLAPPAIPLRPSARLVIPRSELGTIPKKFTVGDALDLIAIIGLDAWSRMGYPQRQAALKEQQ